MVLVAWSVLSGGVGVGGQVVQRAVPDSTRFWAPWDPLHCTNKIRGFGGMKACRGFSSDKEVLNGQDVAAADHRGPMGVFRAGVQHPCKIFGQKYKGSARRLEEH